MIQTCSGKPLEVIETGNKLPEENVILLLRTLFQKHWKTLQKSKGIFKCQKQKNHNNKW